MTRHVLAVLLLCVSGSLRAADVPRFFQQLDPGQVASYRDEWGMPHVYAATAADGYFGLGYVTAEDRLVQVLINWNPPQGFIANANTSPDMIYREPLLSADK